MVVLAVDTTRADSELQLGATTAERLSCFAQQRMYLLNLVLVEYQWYHFLSMFTIVVIVHLFGCQLPSKFVKVNNGNKRIALRDADNIMEWWYRMKHRVV